MQTCTSDQVGTDLRWSTIVAGDKWPHECYHEDTISSWRSSEGCNGSCAGTIASPCKDCDRPGLLAALGPAPSCLFTFLPFWMVVGSSQSSLDRFAVLFAEEAAFSDKKPDGEVFICVFSTFSLANVFRVEVGCKKGQCTIMTLLARVRQVQNWAWLLLRMERRIKVTLPCLPMRESEGLSCKDTLLHCQGTRSSHIPHFYHTSSLLDQTKVEHYICT